MTALVGLQSLSPGLSDATRLAARLGVSLEEIAVHTFPDGEIKVTTGSAAKSTIIYAPLIDPNTKIVALLFASDALRRSGCRRLVLVAPYLCYMRQDTAFQANEAVSQKIVGKLLAAAFDRVITVNAHLHRTANIHEVFPGIEADNLSAVPAIAEHLRRETINPASVIIGPDIESEAWVGELAHRLSMPFLIGRKTRHGDQQVEIMLDPSAVAGRPALIFDDIASSGQTLVVCANALTKGGASCIDAVVTHALFPAAIMAELQGAGIQSIRSTTSAPHVTSTIALDDLLADALASELKR